MDPVACAHIYEPEHAPGSTTRIISWKCVRCGETMRYPPGVEVAATPPQEWWDDKADPFVAAEHDDPEADVWQPKSCPAGPPTGG